ncbi:hypothetical protein NPIL_238381, partial [Nephila pilipes]
MLHPHLTTDKADMGIWQRVKYIEEDLATMDE